MGLVLVVAGLLMIVTGARGTYAQFGSQLSSEFQGTNSFTYQMAAIAAIGAVGYIPALQTISRWLLAFILLVILLGAKGGNGFFAQFQAALQQGPTQPTGTGTVASVGTTISPAQIAAAASGQPVSGNVTVSGITNPNFGSYSLSNWFNFLTSPNTTAPVGGIGTP